MNPAAISRSIASFADIHRLFVERTILASKTSEVAEKGKNKDIVVVGRRKKPKYCSSSIYQLADVIDSAAGKGQYAAIAIAIGGKGEAVAAVGRPLIAAGLQAYALLGAARTISVAVKAVTQTYYGSAPDVRSLIQDGVGKLFGLDKAGEAFVGMASDLAVNAASSKGPC